MGDEKTVRFAINTPNFGFYHDPRLMADLAHEAEESGWDGFFIWDHIDPGYGQIIPSGDPWIILTAMTMTTSRIKLGPMVVPVPRRRPSKLARETVTLDQLSNGRLILGVGIGSDRRREYSSFGESTDDKLHAEMLDEQLEMLPRFWSGETFDFAGKHYQVNGAHFLPAPVQTPRIPIWVAATWPNKKPFRRAAQWDGLTPISKEMPLTPEVYREMIIYILSQRASDQPFDVLAAGRTTGTDKEQDRDKVAAYADAGVTWWQEGFGLEDTLEGLRARIHQGPPIK